MFLSLFFICIAYLMGSVCSAIIICRACSLPDPRTEGSQNPGATNVLRIAGKKYAALVLIADMLKGTIPVLIASVLDAGPTVVACTALAAVVGHMYPLFFGFQGGKGVATALGALLGFHLSVGLLVAATWLLVAKMSRYSSLASLISISAAPVYALLLTGSWGVLPPLCFMAVLILYQHRKNISRLMHGQEPKITFKRA